MRSLDIHDHPQKTLVQSMYPEKYIKEQKQHILDLLELRPIILIRHAQTIANTAGTQVGYTNRTDHVNFVGMNEISSLKGSPFFQEILEKIGSSMQVYVSPTHRSDETARGLFGKEVPLSVREDFSEISFGALEGTSKAEASILKKGLKDPHYRPEGGESKEMVANRMKRSINEIQSSEVYTVIVSHGIAIAALLESIDRYQRELRIGNMEVVLYFPERGYKKIPKDMFG